MRPGLKQQFLDRWTKYFPGAELPLAFHYTDDPGEVELFRTADSHCVIEDIYSVRQGRSLSFDTKSVTCFGGKRYLGFSTALMPNFEYFLSCGIPGKLEGERYKKTPELVKELLKHVPEFTAPRKYVVFKRWDKLDEQDQPQVVIFFAQPDIVSGLFTLANFDEPTNQAVFCPMGAGCATIIQYPMLEAESGHPRAVLGMFDVSARPAVDASSMTFSIPIAKFERMVDDMDESFLITESWNKVKNRIRRAE